MFELWFMRGVTHFQRLILCVSFVRMPGLWMPRAAAKSSKSEHCVLEGETPCTRRSICSTASFASGAAGVRHTP